MGRQEVHAVCQMIDFSFFQMAVVVNQTTESEHVFCVSKNEMKKSSKDKMIHTQLCSWTYNLILRPHFRGCNIGGKNNNNSALIKVTIHRAGGFKATIAPLSNKKWNKCKLETNTNNLNYITIQKYDNKKNKKRENSCAFRSLHLVCPYQGSVCP